MESHLLCQRLNRVFAPLLDRLAEKIAPDADIHVLKDVGPQDLLDLSVITAITTLQQPAIELAENGEIILPALPLRKGFGLQLLERRLQARLTPRNPFPPHAPGQIPTVPVNRTQLDPRPVCKAHAQHLGGLHRLFQALIIKPVRAFLAIEATQHIGLQRRWRAAHRFPRQGNKLVAAFGNMQGQLMQHILPMLPRAQDQPQVSVVR